MGRSELRLNFPTEDILHNLYVIIVDLAGTTSHDHHIGKCALVVKVVREMASVLVN